MYIFGSSQASFKLHKVGTIIRRHLCSKIYNNFSVMYDANGNPNEVLYGKHSTLNDSLKENEVLIKMLASPVNPSDINVIQGVYPVKLPLPGGAGKEGIGEVLSVGKNVENLTSGNLVLADNTTWGCWTHYVKAPVNDFVKCAAGVSLVTAATMMVNTCTAYRMLSDFEDLKPNDVVVQNAANSGAGQCVIQIAAARGLRTINVIRDRPDLEETVDYLKTLGATYVVTEEFVRTPEMKTVLRDLPKPKLALNCVGGRSASQLLKLLGGEGTMVTYGGMSMSPVSIPTSVFIFQNVTLAGFWMSKWHLKHKNTAERDAMFTELFNLDLSGKLKPPRHALSPLENFKETVHKAMEFSSEKQIFKLA